MFKNFKDGWIALIALTFAISALYFVTRINWSSNTKSTPLATIEDVEGPVFTRLSGEKYVKLYEKTKNKDQNGIPIYINQRIHGSLRSSVKIKFSNQSILELSGGFGAFITKIKSQKFIHLLYGNLKTIHYNEKDEILVAHNSYIFSPEDKKQLLLSQLPLINPAPVKNKKNLAPPKLTHLKSKETQKLLDTRQFYVAHIDKKILNQKIFLENCQIKALRSRKGAKGTLIVGFTILSTGETQNTRILSSNIVNSSFEKCISEVFNRMKLDSFQGKPIYFSHTLQFQ